MAMTPQITPWLKPAMGGKVVSQCPSFLFSAPTPNVSRKHPGRGRTF